MQLSSVQPVFKLELNHKVSPGIVTVAKYDGTHPCLTACAGFDKVCFRLNTVLLSEEHSSQQSFLEISNLNATNASVD